MLIVPFSRYQLQQLPAAIASFEKSLSLTPPGVKVSHPDPAAPLPPLTPAQIILADTHTNLGAAYILSKPPRAEKALEHLQKALMVNPDDGEVRLSLLVLPPFLPSELSLYPFSPRSVVLLASTRC